MADYLDDDDTSDQDQRALISIGANYTTPQAKALASRTYRELYSERKGYGAEEDEAMAAIVKSAEEAKAALQQARTDLQAKRFGKAQMYLSMASAFGSPTRTGGFGETLGNVAGSMVEPLREKRKWDEDREKQLLEYQVLTGQIDQNMAKHQLDLIKARRAADARLLSESMRTLSKETRPSGGGSMSTYGKIARDEGFEPGSPEFTERVSELYGKDLEAQRAQAGIDETEIPQNEREALAYEYGVPLANVDPFRGLSTRSAAQARTIEQRNVERQLTALGDQVPVSKKGIMDAERFMQLNKGVETGAIRGLVPSISDAEQEMDAITARVSRKMRVPGEGSTSNFDASQFIKGTMSRTKRFSANKNIAKGYIAFEKDQLGKIAFLENYATVNGHLRGAENMWRQYLEANPIFNPEKPGTFELNKNRLNPTTYFRFEMGGRPAEGEDITDEEAEAIENEPETDEDYAEGGLVEDEYAEGGKVGMIKRFLQKLSELAGHPQQEEYKDALNDQQVLHMLMRKYTPPGPTDPVQTMGPQTREELRRVLKKTGAYAEGGRASSIAAILKRAAAQYSRPTAEETLKEVLGVSGSPKERMDLAHRAKQLSKTPYTVGDRDLERFRRSMGKFRIYGKGGKVKETEEEKLIRELEMARREEMLRAAAQGATLGFADELTPENEADPLAEARERYKFSRYKESHPYESTLPQAAGAIIPALLASRIPGGGNIGSLLTGGALTGGTAGVGGAPEDEGAYPGFQGAVRGAVAAVPAGLAAKYGVHKAGQFADYLRGDTMSGGETKLLESLNKDTINIADIQRTLREARREQVPVKPSDVMGRRSQALVERAATRGSEPAEEFLDELHERQGGTRERVSGQINRGMAPDEYFMEMDKLTDRLYTQSKPLYEVAYANHPGVQSKAVMAMLNTPAGKKAVRGAVELMQNEGEQLGKADITGMVTKPSLKFLDYVKRSMDDEISSEESDGPTNRGRTLRAMRNRLRGELDAASPEYKAARAQYAGDLEVRDALRNGREEFMKWTPEEMRRAVKDMSFAERDAFRSGASQKLFEVIEAPSTDFNAARKIIGSPGLRAKLETLFDDPKKWKIFEAALNKEAKMYDQTKRSLGRVEGARLSHLKKGESLLTMLDPGMSNVPGMGGISALNRVYNWLRFPIQMSEKTANQVIGVINEGDPAKLDATLARLAKAQGRLQKRTRRAGKVGVVAGALAGILTQPSVPGDYEPTEEELAAEEARQLAEQEENVDALEE